MRYRFRDVPSLINRYILRKDNNVFISPVDLRHIRRYAFAAKRFTPGTILDVACGSGYGSELLDGVSTHYTGVDYAAYCIRYARAHYAGSQREFLTCSVFRLSDCVGDRRFDSIVSFETIEHVADPEAMLAVLVGRLAPGGKLVLSIPLNHPDIIYHKKVYNHSDVQSMLRGYIQRGELHLDEFRQVHLDIDPILEPLPDAANGTWLGVLKGK
ncbi:MAG: methyltransferase domain-containing protein [Gemmatimonadota bacterium]